MPYDVLLAMPIDRFFDVVKNATMIKTEIGEG